MHIWSVVCKLGVLALWGAFPIIYGAVNHKLWAIIIIGVISASYHTINYGIIPRIKKKINLFEFRDYAIIYGLVGGTDDTHNNYGP